MNTAHLLEIAEKINAFGKQFTGKNYSTSAKGWKFNPDCALAGVGAHVGDDEGSIETGQTPVGQIHFIL